MKATVPIAIAIAALLFSGCSVSQVINTSGDPKCKDFIAQDEKKQTEEVSKMLKDKSGAEPTTAEISTTRLSAVTYCQTVGKPDPDRRYTPDRGCRFADLPVSATK